MAERILDMENLHVSFDTYAGEVKAVRGVTLHVDEGEVLAIVGESGCGKSVTAQTIMKLNPMPPARIVEGKINLAGHDIVKASEKDMQKIRGQEVAMIFQDPLSSLNPVMTVGAQVIEAVRAHRKVSRREARNEALSLLERVGIRDAAARFDMYPGDFSGGMRQRVMIAMALAGHPRLLIADEPTTAIDTTTQKQILDLLRDLNSSEGMAVLFISHDLGVVTSICSRVHVMYLGQIVEEIDRRFVNKIREMYPGNEEMPRGSSRAFRRSKASELARWRIFRAQCRRLRQYPVDAALRLVAPGRTSVAARRSLRCLP